MLYNALYFLITNPDKLKICRQEVRQYIHQEQKEDASNPDWHSALTYDNLQSMHYLSMCIQETLRLEPSVQVTSTIELSET